MKEQTYTIEYYKNIPFVLQYSAKQIIMSKSLSSPLSSLISLAILVAAAFVSVPLEGVSAFGSFGKKAVKATTPKLPLPTLDPETGRYVRSPLDDGKYPYDAVGSALRHGPSPFFTRIFNADEYEQGVLKYMYSAKCDRAEATGNTDAKLNNAADWAYQKMEETKKGRPKVDYTRLDKKQAALTAVWALGITPLAINAVWSTVDQFINAPGPTAVKYLGM